MRSHEAVRGRSWAISATSGRSPSMQCAYAERRQGVPVGHQQGVLRKSVEDRPRVVLPEPVAGLVVGGPVRGEEEHRQRDERELGVLQAGSEPRSEPADHRLAGDRQPHGQDQPGQEQVMRQVAAIPHEHVHVGHHQGHGQPSGPRVPAHEDHGSDDRDHAERHVRATLDVRDQVRHGPPCQGQALGRAEAHVHAELRPADEPHKAIKRSQIVVQLRWARERRG